VTLAMMMTKQVPLLIIVAAAYTASLLAAWRSG